MKRTIFTTLAMAIKKLPARKNQNLNLIIKSLLVMRSLMKVYLQLIK